MKRTFGILLCCVGVACGSVKKQGASQSDDTTTFDGPQTRFIGHVDSAIAGQVVMSWPGTAAETRFEGTHLSAFVSAGQSQTGATGSETYVDLIVDNGAPQTFKVERQVTEIKTEVAAGTHTARLVKRTEALFGTLTFQGFQTDGKFLNTQVPARNIVFVGDSITAGLGVEGSSSACNSLDATVANSNASFGVDTATALHADYALLAWSGKGAYANRDSSDKVTIPKLYELADPTNSASTYDFSQTPAAQVVVVNLGTNDFAAFGNQTPAVAPDQAGYTAALKSLAQGLRGHYPEAHIILAVGPMVGIDFPVKGALATWKGYVQSVVKEMNGSGDNKVLFYEFAALQDNFGCDYHPNKVAAQNMSAGLVTQIRALTKW